MRRAHIVAALLAMPCPVVVAQTVAARVTSPRDRQLITQLVAIEDARDTVILGNDVRRKGLASENPFVRAFAARGLGRLERRAMVEFLSPMLGDPSAEARVAAADAIAQSVARGGEDAARSVLEARLAPERDPAVRSMLLESLGRLRQGSAERLRATAAALGSGLSTSTVERHGAIRGLFFLSRKPEARTAGAFSTAVTDQAFALLTANGANLSGEDRVNLAGLLVNAGALDGRRIIMLAAHSDPYVRDRALAALARVGDTSLARSVVNAAVGDQAAIVRYRSIGVFARRLRTSGCGPLTSMAADRDPTVSLAAIDALSGCRSDAATVRFLDSLAALPVTGDRWHAPAHAIVALASLDPARARTLFPGFETAGNVFVRMYADSAARVLRDTAALYRLARDQEPNVRSSAIDGLSALVGHAADSAYRAALTSNDNQLLRSATAALNGATADNDATLAALGAAWRRLHDANPGRETSKDGQKALADRILERGGRVPDGAMTLPKMPTPTFEDLAAMEKLTATIEMADGSVIDFKLHPFEAPTNAARFVRLARAGTFDGLTFHRVAPFFVVQGPSPNANEYSAPDGPFTRDELGHSNLRGTVGLSTRGRDTGDGQFYVNLVDNVYLDHDYTVMGTIVSGLAGFDRMQEGAKIKRIFVR